MKNAIVNILTTLLLLCVVACDDNTGSLGNSIIPGADSIEVKIQSYQATTRSIKVDSVLGRTGKVYLGRFSDPETGSMLEADFIAQFNCAEGGNVFPENIIGDTIAYRTELRLFFTSFFGDSTNTMTAEVYDLEHTLEEGVRYYTNTDFARYYDTESKPIAQQVYTAIDYSIDEDELEDPEHYANVCIPLPTEIGTSIIKKYREHPEYFANASNFINNVCKGYYVKCSQGDGTVLYVDQVSLNVYFQIDSDSLFVTQFAGSQEVLQTNRFSTQKVEHLIDDNTCTYLKTPAGIFTEVTLPIDDMTAEGDSINSAKITFTRYNSETTSRYEFGIPKMLLMVRKSDLNQFFEKNKLTDNVTSYYTTFDATYNHYEYTNIARLIIHCANERQAWLVANPDKNEEDYAKAYPDWDKVMLVPVTTITDSKNNIVNFRHDLELNSVRLIGGQNKVDITVISSRFK